MRVVPTSLLLLVLSGGAAAQQEAAEPPRALQQLAQQQLRRLECQTELPGVRRGYGSGGVGNRHEGTAREPLGDAPEPGGARLEIGGGGSGIAEALFWSLMVAIAVALAVAVVRQFSERATVAKGKETKVASAPAPVAAAAKEAVPDHVRLAREGRHGEAIHALLLAALALLAEALGRALPRDATAREALRLARPLPQSGTALRELVHRAERSHFGGCSAGAADYDNAVRHFADWSAACRSHRA